MADSKLQQLAKTDRNPAQESEYQALLKSQPSTGGSKVSLPDFDSVLGKQAADRQNFYGGVKAQQGEFLDRYRGAIGSQEGSQALYDRISKELGVDPKRQIAGNLENMLLNMPQTQRQATTGFDVSQNQLDRLIAKKTSDLAPAYGTAQRALESAEGNLTQRMGFAREDQAKELLPYQMESGLMSSRLAMEATGFNTGQQNELSSIIAKMNAGIQLSQMEMQQANALAEREQNYEMAKTKMEQESKTNRFINVGGKLYDPVTGQWISPPKDAVGGGGITSTQIMNNIRNSSGTGPGSTVQAQPVPPSYFKPI